MTAFQNINGETDLKLGAGNAHQLSDPVLGTLLFVFAETMFFCGLISAYLVLREQAPVWPPLGQPRLPIVITGVNTAILLGSGAAIWKASEHHREGERTLTQRWWQATIFLGGVFLLIQGSEWSRLLDFGLRSEGSVYGATFYTLVGAHAAHVVGGVLVLGWGLWRSHSRVGLSQAQVSAIQLFWSFIVLVWPLLYVLFYLW